MQPQKNNDGIKLLILLAVLVCLLAAIAVMAFNLIRADSEQQKSSAANTEVSRPVAELPNQPAHLGEQNQPAHLGEQTLQEMTNAAAVTNPAGDVPPLANVQCGFAGLKLPADSVVYAAGAYSGRKLSMQIDQSGHEATQMDIVVNRTDKPVVLMLGAYEPTVWNIGWTPGTRIVAAYVSGYHRQAVTGLSAQVPVLNSSHENQGPCGYFYVSNDNLPKLNPLARQLFGRSVDMAYQARNGQAVLGAPLPANVRPVQAGGSPAPTSFRLKDVPLAGEAGLQEALRQGILRPATESDALAWRQANGRDRDSPPLSGAEPRRVTPGFNAYVIQKPFRIPAGLYGAHMATFYLAKGVPYPTGNLGHSVLYDLNNGTCRGAVCGMR